MKYILILSILFNIILLIIHLKFIKRYKKMENSLMNLAENNIDLYSKLHNIFAEPCFDTYNEKTKKAWCINFNKCKNFIQDDLDKRLMPSSMITIGTQKLCKNFKKGKDKYCDNVCF